MSKIIHYIFCAIKIIIAYILKILVVFCDFVCCIYRCIVCILLLNTRKKAQFTDNLDLHIYYPDTGKLSDTKGYRSEKTNYDLSIIIPMYNAEEYIDDCINSIVSQKADYTYEIILIDDGSADNTLSTVQKYLDNPTVKLIKQENSGQSVARNKAIFESSGNFLMFVDSDDILLPGSIQCLLYNAEKTNSDIVEGSVVRFLNHISDDMIKNSMQKYHVESYSNNQKFVLSCYGYSVAKVYKRYLWETLKFPEGYIFEDMITRYILRRKANRVAFIDDVVYGYRYNNNSSSHGQNHLKKLDSIWVLPKIFKLVEQENAPLDETFYLLALKDIGILNFVTTRPFDLNIKLACFVEMEKQLESIQFYRPKKMPLMFRLLERSILENKFEAWEYIAGTINKYGMLKKWREVN